MIVVRGATYFGIVFAVGFVLGVVRVLWAVPLVGERAAELMEAPLMLVAIFFAARLVTRRFAAPRRSEYLYSGLLAVVLLLSMELLVVLQLRGMSFGQYLAERDPVAGVVYLLMLLIFAIMPWLIGTTQSADQT